MLVWIKLRDETIRAENEAWLVYFTAKTGPDPISDEDLTLLRKDYDEALKTRNVMEKTYRDKQVLFKDRIYQKPEGA